MDNINKQRGQSLILVTLFLGVLSLTVSMVFNAGMLSKERIKNQNTADAAAYSSAIFVARDLNFQSYTNRAMVANQVAIAQYVGLSSWVRMEKIASTNLAMVTAWIPYVNAVTRIMNQIMTQVDKGAQQALPFATTGTNYVLKTISIGQKAFHINMGLSSLFVAKNIVEANDTKASFGAMSNALFMADTQKIWLQFIDSVDTESEDSFDQERTKNFREVVNASRDKFSKRRSYKWFGFTIPKILKIRVKKRGGSELVKKDGKYVWTGVDTVALWVGRYKRKKWKWRWKWNEVPIGYASSRTSEYNLGKRQNGPWGNTWGDNRLTSQWATKTSLQGGTYDGLQDFYDIKASGRLTKAPSVRIVLGKQASKVRTSFNTTTQGDGNALGRWGAGSLDIEKGSKFQGGEMSSVARAEAYFKRPRDLNPLKRVDSRYEYANLYSPYWQARLVETSRIDRNKAAFIINAI